MRLQRTKGHLFFSMVGIIHQGFGSSGVDLSASVVTQYKDTVADWQLDHVKWMPGTAGDQAWCRRDPPVLQPELQEEISPREHGEPQQCRSAGLRAAECLLIVLCMGNEQIWAQKWGFIWLDGPGRL